MEAGRFAAGSGRAGANPSRLDPFSLPVRFTAADDAIFPITLGDFVKVYEHGQR